MLISILYPIQIADEENESMACFRTRKKTNSDCVRCSISPPPNHQGWGLTPGYLH